MRVLVTEPVHGDCLARLQADGHQLIDRPADLDAALAEAEAILVRTLRLDAALLAKAPQLRFIAKHGAGVDNIGQAAARARGIALANTPGANAGSVAEQALMLILALARGLTAQLAARHPDPRLTIRDLAGRHLVVVGWGASARQLAGFAQALGMTVGVVWPRRAGGQTDEGFAVAASLRDALAGADVLSLHCPLSPATRHMIDAAALAALPAGALVINTARGGLIDEAALAQALLSGHLGGAGLDVLEHEPTRPDEPLLAIPGALLTPHLAGMGDGAFRQVGLMAAANITAFAKGLLDPAVVLIAPPPR